MIQERLKNITGVVGTFGEIENNKAKQVYERSALIGQNMTVPEFTIT